MKDKEDSARRATAKLEMHLASVKPVPQTTQGITINGGTFVIGDHNHITLHPEPERLTEAQSGKIKSLIGQIYRLMKASDPAYHPATPWNKLNKHMGVDHHRHILKREVDDALEFLNEWLQQLENP